MSEHAIKDAILIAGPTASGKSALALRLAQMTGGYIVNADSMQVYDVLNLLTARPSDEDQQCVDHYLYGHVSPSVSYSTGRWVQDVEDLIGRPEFVGRIPVFVGGTGLYFRALLGGLSDMPAVSDDVRQYWRERMEREGASALFSVLEKRDPVIANTLRPTDSQRIVRALEVVDCTGRSLLDWQLQKGKPVVDDAKARKIVLLPERGLLGERIAQRFNLMWDNGALDEVRALLALELDASLPAMKAIGVREIADYFSGRKTREEAVERSIIATRQYAKRQSTWFRNQLDESWKFYTSGDDISG